MPLLLIVRWNPAIAEPPCKNHGQSDGPIRLSCDYAGGCFACCDERRTMESSENGKVLVLSPHLDDAVFGCGELIARCPGAIVLTLLAGAPEGFNVLTEWDAASGFTSAQ